MVMVAPGGWKESGGMADGPREAGHALDSSGFAPFAAQYWNIPCRKMAPLGRGVNNPPRRGGMTESTIMLSCVLCRRQLATPSYSGLGYARYVG